MKRIVTFLLIVTLIFSLSISAFADDSFVYGDVTLPSFESLMSENRTEYPYSFIVFYKEEYVLFFLVNETYVNNSGQICSSTGKAKQYKLSNGQWVLQSSTTAGPRYMISTALVWSLQDLIYEGSVVWEGYDPYPPAPVECDGSSCPANDVDHDNICDDCGKVLTMSLRSTLLDYAKYQAEEFSPLAETHTYYAVVEHLTEADSYLVYASQIPMASTDDGNTVKGGDMRVTKVLTMENGSFANQGWTTVDSWSGKVVYANHTIPFFFRVPLTVTLQGPTGELMEMEAPNLTKEFSTLALCGIGCLALLISLRVLSDSLRKISHRT